jgi:hypothetical protein
MQLVGGIAALLNACHVFHLTCKCHGSLIFNRSISFCALKAA